jgi:hypothetical protein
LFVAPVGHVGAGLIPEQTMPPVCRTSLVAAFFLLALAPPARVDAQGQGPPSERAALMALYEATGGPQWTVRTGWGTDAPVCDWAGVVCDGEDVGAVGVPLVVRLALPGNQLRGTLPPSLASLSLLHTLDVSGNALHGAVPAALIERANQNQLTLRIAGTSLDEALTALTMRIDRHTGVCSGDADLRLVIDPSGSQAHIEAVRCRPDPKTRQPVTCLRATTQVWDLDLVSRALRRLGLASTSQAPARPGLAVVDHEVRYTTTYTWGNGATGRIFLRDDAGPIDVLIAQRLLIDLIPAGWDREAEAVACETFAWTR